jgi:hypothetical protein
MKTFVDYIRGHTDRFRYREHILDMFSYQPDRAVYPDKPELVGGIVFTSKPKSIKSARYGYYDDNDEFQELVPSTFGYGAPFAAADEITITPKDIPTLTKASCDTIIGQFLANQYLLVDAIGNHIPYIENGWNIEKVERKLGQLVIDRVVEVKDYLKYVEHGYELGHFGELFVPTMSRRSTSAPKHVLARRDELLKIHANELTDPKVVAAIEKELVQMYKEYIGDDPVAGYLESKRKSYPVTAKQMNIMIGGVGNFGGGANDITLIPKSLAEGWEKEHFTALANNIRSGAYARGVETQNGGTLTKLIFRAFQDIKLVDGDCGSTKFVVIDFDATIKPEMFIGRTVIIDGKRQLITADNASKFADKKGVKLRSPIYCKEPAGICLTCMGNVFRQLEIYNPGTLAITVTSAMMGAAMAAMHVESINVQPLDFDKYLI